MTELAHPLVLDEDNPYPGPPSFREGQSAFFFGRDQESRALYDLVRRETLVVLFGKSGTGKSSLLRAGLFPRLAEGRPRHLPIFVHFSFAPGMPPPRRQLRDSILAARDVGGVQAPDPGDADPLWLYLQRTPFWGPGRELLVPTLILDQFEEVFTVGRHDPGLEAAIEEIADVAENRIPRVLLDNDAELPPGWQRPKAKVLLALREDFLPQLEELRPLMPSLAVNRLRLKELTGTQAVTAVTLDGRATFVAEPEARLIVRTVAGLSASAGPRSPWTARPAGGALPAPDNLDRIEVHPAILSLYCWELNQRRKKRPDRKITEGLIVASTDLLPAFYDRCLQGLPSKVDAFIERQLLDADGHRTSVAIANVRKLLGRDEDDESVDTTIVDPLVERRLLSKEARYGTVHIELVHDVMAQVLQARKEAQRQKRIHRLNFALVVTSLVAIGIAGWLAAPRAKEAEPNEQVVRQREAAAKNSGRVDQIIKAAEGTVDPTVRTLIVASLAGEAAPPGGLDRCRKLILDAPAAAILRGHRDTIESVAFSPDSQHVVTASKDGSARIWPSDGGKEPTVLAGHTGAVTVARFSPDGTLVVTGSEDGTIRIWTSAGGYVGVVGKQDVFRGNAIVDAQFSPDGDRLLVRSRQGQIRLFDTAHRRPIIESRHATDSPFLVAAFGHNGRDIHAVSWDGLIHSWRERGWSQRPGSQLPGGMVARAVFSPDGSLAAIAASDGQVKLWPLETEARGVPIALPPAPADPSGVVTELAFGTTFLAIARPSEVWTVSLDAQGAPPRPSSLIRPTEHVAISSLAVAPGGPNAAAGDALGGRLFQAAAGAGADGGSRLAFATGVTGLRARTISNDGRLLATTGTDYQVRIWPLVRKPIPDEWQELLRYARASTTACLDPDVRTQILGERRDRAEAAFASCERAFHRGATVTVAPQLQPFASYVPSGKTASGSPQYTFTVGLHAPPAIAEQIETVSYHLHHEQGDHRRDWNKKAPNFSADYIGWGCFSNVTAHVNLKDGSATSIDFDMCKLLGW